MARETELLVVNRRVELLRPNDSTIYSTLIQKVGEDYFAIGLPMVGDTEVPLHQGERVEIRITTDRGRFFFHTEVLSRDWDRVPLYRLAWPKEIKRQQLREFVRWRVALEVKYEPITVADLKTVHLRQPRRRAVSLDLSGGGLQMLVKEPLPVDSLLLLQLELPGRRGQETITAVGKVRRLSVHEGEGPMRYAVGVSFEHISERDRDIVIGFIFQRMVAERQRGL